MRVVIALGGNALLRRGERPDAAPQVDQVAHVAGPLAALARDHEVVVVHGNGPQVGLLALESAADRSLIRPYQVVVQIRASGLCHTDIHAGIRPVTARGRGPWLSWFTALSPQSPRSRLAVGTSKGRQPNCALLDTGSAFQS